MCLNISRVERTFTYNWSGDRIISPLVSAARLVPGSRRTSLDMDVREFLAIEHSAELRNFFRKRIVDEQPASAREKFFIGRKGSFDWRMRCVIEAFGRFKHLPVKGRAREEWLLPAETLANGGGDCEDLAFLLMALLGEAGVSQSCLRVAFGHLVETQPNGSQRQLSHAWVMYQMESGVWIILDPLERVEQHLRAKSPVKPRPAVAAASYEYRPLFVFNRNHLWRVHGPKDSKHVLDLDSYLGRRTFWKEYNPSFAMGVHSDIFDRQMKELSALERFTVKSASFDLDASVLMYDPRDHCDFGYINESWARVQTRLDSGDSRDLGFACHTVGDFYAHSLYAHVVEPVADQLPLYDPAQPVNPGAKQDEVFDRAKFSINNDAPALNEAQTRAFWQGKLVSGQWWRWYTTYPDEIQTKQELAPRRCLPDHDLLAVDAKSSENNPKHLYPTKAAYNRQFDLRKNAAERHVRALFLTWYARHRA